MLRCSARRVAPAAKVCRNAVRERAGSFPSSSAVPRSPQHRHRHRHRPSSHATGDCRDGKPRFDLRNALRRDRERVLQNRTLPWRERLEEWKAYPWKAFLLFMVLWTWLGTYVVPYMKGDRVSSPPLAVRARQEMMAQRTVSKQ